MLGSFDVSGVRDGAEVIITLKTDVDRYDSIAKRWPEIIVLVGSEAQIVYFLTHGMYEAGCMDIVVPADPESKIILDRLRG